MENPPEHFLGWLDVRPLFGGISRTTAWRGVRDGWLPAPIRISPGRKAWRSSDIAAWQAELDPRTPKADAGPSGGQARPGPQPKERAAPAVINQRAAWARFRGRPRHP